MLDHRIYHMPFSRSLRLTASDAHGVDRLYKECMEKGGVLLVQPEHMLSFKLMGIEYRESGREEVSRILLGTQHFFNLHSRDIVDESDENFSVKFELIYTMGTQRPIELSPERWTLIQRLLSIVAWAAPTIQGKLPESIEVTHRSEGRFPRTRILREDAQNPLLSKVAREVCDIGLPGFPIARQSIEVRKSVLAYISDAHLSSDQIASIEGNSTFFTESTKAPCSSSEVWLQKEFWGLPSVRSDGESIMVLTQTDGQRPGLLFPTELKTIQQPGPSSAILTLSSC